MRYCSEEQLHKENNRKRIPMLQQIHRQRYPKTIVSTAVLQSPSDNLLYHLHLGTKAAEQHSLYCPNSAQQIAKGRHKLLLQNSRFDRTKHILAPIILPSHATTIPGTVPNTMVSAMVRIGVIHGRNISRNTANTTA